MKLVLEAKGRLAMPPIPGECGGYRGRASGLSRGERFGRLRLDGCGSGNSFRGTEGDGTEGGIHDRYLSRMSLLREAMMQPHSEGLDKLTHTCHTHGCDLLSRL